MSLEGQGRTRSAPGPALQAILDSIEDDTIFVLDPLGHILTWNPGARAIAGYAAEEIQGESFTRFYTPEEQAAGRPQRLLQIAAAEGRVESQGWRMRRDGSGFLASVIVTALWDEQQALRGFVEVTRDLTEQQAVRGRDEFIAIAAHELRTPLTALQLRLQGLARVLGREPSELRQRLKLGDRLDGALRHLGRLAELVERLLDVTRIAAGRLELRIDACDLAEVVRQIAGEFQEEALQAGSVLRVTAPAQVAGRWDRSRVHLVLSNLLANAIKYGSGEPIDLLCEVDHAVVRLTVRDRGIGISAADVARIFGPFERAAPVQNYGGLGLGLYISRHIVEAHGGAIAVSSRAGEGSTFTVILPLSPAAEGAA